MFSNGSLVEYVTLEIDPKQKLYGTQIDIVGDATKLLDYFTKSIDILILNGVLGWGGKRSTKLLRRSQKMINAAMMVSADKF